MALPFIAGTSAMPAVPQLAGLAPHAGLCAAEQAGFTKGNAEPLPAVLKAASPVPVSIALALHLVKSIGSCSSDSPCSRCFSSANAFL